MSAPSLGIRRSEQGFRAGADAPGASGMLRWALLFLPALAAPIMIYMGPIRLSPYRIVLLATFVPCLMMWLGGRNGKAIAPDFLVLLAAFWGAMALLVTTGVAEGAQTAGIFFVETFGAYLLARMAIRTYEDFAVIVRVAFWMIAILLPFAVLESLTDRSYPLELLDKAFNTIGKAPQDPRFGLYRAQVVFEHSILYGPFCASLFTIMYFMRGVTRAGIVAVATCLSISSGALGSLFVQGVLIAWERMTRTTARRWLILGVLFVMFYVFIDIMSNRSPFHVIVSYLSFSVASGYNRIQIWNFGIAEVFRHPIVGIGLGDWIRAPWMSPSIDNFWLVTAMRYGAPTFLFLAAGIVTMMVRAGRASLTDPKHRAARMGLLISLVGFIVSGCTVHYWNAIYCWFFFLVGSAGWILNAQASGEPEAASSVPAIARSASPYLRPRYRHASVDRHR